MGINFTIFYFKNVLIVVDCIGVCLCESYHLYNFSLASPEIDTEVHFMSNGAFSISIFLGLPAYMHCGLQSWALFILYIHSSGFYPAIRSFF